MACFCGVKVSLACCGGVEPGGWRTEAKGKGKIKSQDAGARGTRDKRQGKMVGYDRKARVDKIKVREIPPASAGTQHSHPHQDWFLGS